MKKHFHQLDKQVLSLIAVIAGVLFFSNQVFSQGVVISNNPANTPDASAILDLSYITNKGFLTPRVVLSGSGDFLTVPSPANGLLVYHTGGFNIPAGFYYNAGFSGAPNWTSIGSGTVSGTASLVNGKIWIGDGSSIAQEQTMSGDVIFTSNTGVTAIQDNAVDGTDISITGEVDGKFMQYNGTDWVISPTLSYDPAFTTTFVTGKFDASQKMFSGSNGNTGGLSLYSEQGVTDYTIDLMPNPAMTQDIVLFFPSNIGAPGQILGTDGTGTLIWTNNSPDQTVTITGAGINTVSGTYPNFTITGTEIDGSITNEGSLTVNGGTATTSVINSNTSGSTDVTFTAGTGLSISELGNVITLTNSSPDQTVALTGAGINAVTGTYPNFTITGTEVDGSITNEGSLTVNTGTATTSVINSNTSGSTDVTFTAGTGLSISEAGNVITLANTGLVTEVDGSITNEGILGVGLGSGTSSTLTTNTSTGAEVTINAGTGLSIAETTGANGGSITLTNSSPDQTVTITGAGIDVVTGTYPNFTITGTEVDGSITNEGTLSVGVGSATTSLIQSNTNLSPAITLSAGTGMSISESGNTITLSTSGVPVGADPTASVILTAVNGSATTYMRSDAAPALSEAIAPVWTGIHKFTGAIGVDEAQLVVAATADNGSAAITFNENHTVLSQNAAKIHHEGTHDGGYLEIEDFSTSWSNVGLVIKQGNVGIKTLAPASLFSVGDLNQFQVNLSGNLIKINNADYSWPAANATADGQVLTSLDNGTLSWVTPAATGVTSVALALPTTIFDVSGSPVTSTGTLSATFDNQTANTVFAGPTSGIATPGFRALVSADIPSLSGSYINNSTSVQAGANFNIGDAGVIGTTLNVGGLSTLAALTQVGTASINGSGSATTTIGNVTAGSTIIQRVNTSFTLDGVAASTYAIGASTTTGTIVIGGTAQTAAITVGSSSAAQTLNLGTGAGLSTVNIATGAAANVVNIANGASAGTVQIGNSNKMMITNLGVTIGYTGSAPNNNLADAINIFRVNGKVRSNGVNESSDMRWKKNIIGIDGALGKVLLMNGRYYDWRISEFPGSNFSEGRQVGLIAQEIEKVLPEVVSTDAAGYKAVEYSHIVPVLIEAIKEQQKIIDGQNSTITDLKASLENVLNRVNSIEKSVDLNNSKVQK